MPDNIPTPPTESPDTMQPTTNEFHQQLHDILDKYPIGYEQALEVLEIVGKLFNEGASRELLHYILGDYLIKIGRAYLIEKIGIDYTPPT